MIAARVRAGVADVVHKQVETGIDVVNDGEFSKPGFNILRRAARLEKWLWT